MRRLWDAATRSLTAKLTAAFLLVGVLGIILFAVVLGLQVRVEFTRFISSRDIATFASALEQYYTDNGGWRDVNSLLDENPQLGFFRRDAVVANADGAIILGDPSHGDGTLLSSSERTSSQALTVDGATVGYIFLTRGPGQQSRGGPGPGPLESELWSRLLRVSILSGLGTMLVALLVGILLARTLTRPVAELTAATRAMAAGDLHQQVTVRSHDEMGELAHSFNSMSADLARASTLRKQMTADLAHDLRTPLSVLSGYAEGLRDGRLSGSAALFTLMHEEVLHLKRLVDDLRTLSLADAGELPLNRRTVDPTALLERTALAHMLPAEERGLTLDMEADPNLPSVNVDTDRMAQVLNNLVSNAMRHTAQGSIHLEAHRRNGHVALSVQDTGSGIAPEDLPFVFDRLYRGDKARQRDNDASSGLGLAIAKAIVEAHGGTLGVTSTPGAGATFTVLLPVAKRDATA